MAEEHDRQVAGYHREQMAEREAAGLRRFDSGVKVVTPVASPVDTVRASIDKHLDFLANAIDNHGQAIAPILNTDLVGADLDPPETRPGSSPMVTWLSDMDERLRFLTSRLAAMTSGAETNDNSTF